MKLYPNEIPKNATCVFTGVLFRIWQWPQVEFDGNTKTYEMAEHVPTLWVIAESEGKIILQREVHSHNPSMPFWSLPGGKGGFEEDLLEGAKRELREESGYESDNWTLFHHANETDMLAWHTYVYVARNARKTCEPELDGGENIEVSLLSVKEFLAHVEREDFRGNMMKILVEKMRRDPSAMEAFMRAIQN